MALDPIVVETFGWIGTSLALFFFLSPINMFIGLFKGTTDIKTIPWMIMLASIGNCVCWAVYGILKESIQIWSTNFGGLAIQLTYLLIFYVFQTEKHVLKSFLYSSITVIFVIGVYLGFYYLEIEYEGLGKKDYIAGNCAMAFNIILYMSPCQKIYYAIKETDPAYIPYLTSIIGIVCGSCWVIYGGLGSYVDWNIIVPNSVAILFGIINLIVFAIVYIRRMNMPVKEREFTKTYCSKDCKRKTMHYIRKYDKSVQINKDNLKLFKWGRRSYNFIDEMNFKCNELVISSSKSKISINSKSTNNGDFITIQPKKTISQIPEKLETEFTLKTRINTINDKNSKNKIQKKHKSMKIKQAFNIECQTCSRKSIYPRNKIFSRTMISKSDSIEKVDQLMKVSIDKITPNEYVEINQNRQLNMITDPVNDQQIEMNCV